MVKTRAQTRAARALAARALAARAELMRDALEALDDDRALVLVRRSTENTANLLRKRPRVCGPRSFKTGAGY